MSWRSLHEEVDANTPARPALGQLDGAAKMAAQKFIELRFLFRARQTPSAYRVATHAV